MSPAAKARLETLRSAPLNTWIALSEDESKIIAVGKTYSEVSERSEQAGAADPIILRTPSQWVPFSV
jgi:hypothetical protein